MTTESGTAGLLAVVSPVFNDWICADELLARLAGLADALPAVTVYLVDDGSTDPVDLHPERWSDQLAGVRIVHAGTNLGHQRAIALGLATVIADTDAAVVVVIDADGEDDPSGIPALLERLAPEGPSIVVAQRTGRTEALSFRAFYRLYRAGFRVLTGRPLDFGNFSALTRPAVDRLLYMPELWNHFPASVMRSRMPMVKVPTARSTRFHGTSRMNFVSLVNHGLAAMSTFSDVVFTRLLTLVTVMSALFVAAGVAVAAIRLFSTVAIPGWATAAMGFILLALFQFLTLLAVMTFIQLASRSNIPSTPREAAPRYVRSVEQVSP